MNDHTSNNHTTNNHTTNNQTGPTSGPTNGPIVRDRGQATTEYALVLLAAALVGVLVVGWATAGGGAAAIGGLFDRVIQSVMDQL